MKILIIDDAVERHIMLAQDYHEEYPEAVLHSAFCFDDAVKFLAKNEYDFISFDHDLTDFKQVQGKTVEFTGASIARHMAEAGMKCPRVRVHSSNPAGAMNIVSIIQSGDVSTDVFYEPITARNMDMLGLKAKFNKLKEEKDVKDN